MKRLKVRVKKFVSLPIRKKGKEDKEERIALSIVCENKENEWKEYFLYI